MEMPPMRREKRWGESWAGDRALRRRLWSGAMYRASGTNAAAAGEGAARGDGPSGTRRLAGAQDGFLWTHLYLAQDRLLVRLLRSFPSLGITIHGSLQLPIS